MKPIGDWILLRPAVKDAQSSGRHGEKVWIPERSRTSANVGIVEGVGSGWRHPDGALLPIVGVEVGDRVLFVKRKGVGVFINNEPRLLLRYEDVLGVVEVEE